MSTFTDKNLYGNNLMFSIFESETILFFLVQKTKDYSSLE